MTNPIITVCDEVETLSLDALNDLSSVLRLATSGQISKSDLYDYVVAIDHMQSAYELLDRLARDLR